MTKRPYFNFSADQLRQIVEGNNANTRTLKQVAAELRHRKTRAAKKLLIEVDALVDRPRRDSRTQHPSGMKANIPKPTDGKHNQDAGNASTTSGRKRERKDSERNPPINIDTEYKSANDADATLTCLKLRPGFIGRLAGRSTMRLTFKDDTIHIYQGESHVSYPAAVIQCHDVKSRIFSASLVITFNTSAGKRISLKLPRRSQAEECNTWMSTACVSHASVKANHELKELLESDIYISTYMAMSWHTKHANPIAISQALNATQAPNGGQLPGPIHRIANWRGHVSRRNTQFVKDKSNQYCKLFAELESHPLSSRQVEAILRDDNHTLVVAGAGTGKTSTVVGKVGYLLESKQATPDQILALAYGRDAATEIRREMHRVSKILFNVQPVCALCYYCEN